MEQDANVQLDQSRIAIRERTWADNLDLALHVLRRYGGPLAVCALVTTVPLGVLNHLFLTWRYPDLLSDEAFVGSYFWMAFLVLVEAPLATAPVTLYLGQALFVQRPRPTLMARAFAACAGQLILLQVVVRAILIAPLLTAILPFALWPYLNEVILLERNPMIGGRDQMSTLRRSSLLHYGRGGDYLIRAAVAGFLSVLLIGAIYLTEDMLARNLVGFEPGPIAWLVALQIAFWLVAVYFTVARFLNYLDTRIRNEGWEVELLLRAQRARFTRQIA